MIAYPVRSAGCTIVGVLALGLNLTRLQTLFSDIPLPDGSVVTLTDAKSRVLARSHDAERYIGNGHDPESGAAAQMCRRDQTQVGLDGVERFYGNAVVDAGPWLLSVGIPTSRRGAATHRLWRRSLAIIGVAIGSALILALWLSYDVEPRSERPPFRRAAHRATATCRRRATLSVANLELAQLQDAFITMAGNLRDTHDALDHQVEQERKMRETLQSLQRQVVRQERLAAVGVLVSGVAHELNNPLQAILGTAELLERDPASRAPALRGDRVRQDAERPRARDHPQPLAVQQPAVRSAGARRSARRHRRSRPAAPRATSKSPPSRSTSKSRRRDRCTPTSPRSSRSR